MNTPSVAWIVLVSSALGGCAIVNSIDNRSQDLELDELRQRTLRIESRHLRETAAGQQFIATPMMEVTVRLGDAAERTPAGVPTQTEWIAYAIPAHPDWTQIALAACAAATATRDLDAPVTGELRCHGEVEAGVGGPVARFPSMRAGRFHLVAIRRDRDPEVSTERAAHALITVSDDGAVTWDAPFVGVKSRRHAAELVDRARSLSPQH